MTLILRMLTATLGFAACQPSIAQTVDVDFLASDWQVATINGEPFVASATLDLSTAGKIAGQGPCNRFFGSYDGPLPEFRPKDIASTRMACPDLAAESALFEALSVMTRAEAGGSTSLLLSGPDGRTIGLIRLPD